MFFQRLSPHTRAILQALFVTFLWSTSWVLIKIGLEDIPALTFAGLRYTIAFGVLLVFARRTAAFDPIRQLSRADWLYLAALGILLYSVTQGAQFLSLFYLPAITANILLSFTAVLVAFIGLWTLGERPTRGQWGGTLLYIVGVLLFFGTLTVVRGEAVGLSVALVGVLANALAAVLGRYVNRKAMLSPMLITLITMGIGSAVLLTAGILIQGLPRLSLTGWLIVLWLAVVNSAYAFTLWNKTLRMLSALESSVINNMMSVQIPILAVIFLGERLNGRQLVGLVLAAVGILAVQVLRPKIATTVRGTAQTKKQKPQP